MRKPHTKPPGKSPSLEACPEEGTGIGLVVAKRLVELMGRAIGAESTVGAGTVFWFELASAAAPRFAVGGAEPAAHAKAQVKNDASLHTLLYVEDNPANLQLVEQLIARHTEMRLLTAVNGQLGIALARTAQPEVIVMDINLPDISGVTALKILRDDPATAHIPVIAISANAMPRFSNAFYPVLVHRVAVSLHASSPQIRPPFPSCFGIVSMPACYW